MADLNRPQPGAAHVAVSRRLLPLDEAWQRSMAGIAWPTKRRADRNIGDLLETMHRDFHRLRQSGINAELFDVIAGFEALSDEPHRAGSR